MRGTGLLTRGTEGFEYGFEYGVSESVGEDYVCVYLHRRIRYYSDGHLSAPHLATEPATIIYVHMPNRIERLFGVTFRAKLERARARMVRKADALQRRTDRVRQEIWPRVGASGRETIIKGQSEGGGRRSLRGTRGIPPPPAGPPPPPRQGDNPEPSRPQPPPSGP